LAEKGLRKKEPDKSFEFRQCVKLMRAVPLKARDLGQLREHIARVSENSIYHHMYEYFLKGHRLEYTNDFAQWAGENLEARALAESLSSIDPYAVGSVQELRAQLLRAIDYYREHFPDPGQVPPGEEFHFNETVTVVFPVGLKARNLAEFLIALRHVDAGAIYYHFYEARRRLKERTDDFSQWVKDVLGKEALAQAIRSIDPFMHTIEGIREHVLELVDAELRKEMEVLPP
jgi:hypothetical protein